MIADDITVLLLVLFPVSWLRLHITKGVPQFYPDPVYLVIRKRTCAYRALSLPTPSSLRSVREYQLVDVLHRAVPSCLIAE